MTQIFFDDINYPKDVTNVIISYHVPTNEKMNIALGCLV